MKKIISLLMITAAIGGFYACSGSKKSQPSGTVISRVVEDTAQVEYYDAEFEGQQKSYKDKIVGKWKIVSMQRQAKMPLEKLENVTITIEADSSFSGKAPCNSMSGDYTLKGASIRFGRILTTKMACEHIQQETVMVQLLEKRVSTFSLAEGKLMLLDGSSNTVFVCER